MKLTGLQYYWIIAVGLLLQLLLAFPMQIYFTEIEQSTFLKVLVLAVMVPVGICYLTVLLEMWSVFRFRAIVCLLILGLLAKYLHPAFLFIAFVSPHLYWLYRIKGIPAQHEST